MLSFSSRQRYFLYRDPTDMRKGFNGLSGLVRQHLEHDLLSGDVFIFLNKRRDRIKLLVWDRNGFVVWYKALERGTLELPAAEMDSLEMSWTDIQLLLEGIEIKSARKRKRYLPLYQALRQNVLATDYLQGDESTIKVLDSNKPGKTHLGYQWVFRNPTSGNVLFVYRKGRGANGLTETLEEYSGYLQFDGYAAYDKFARGRQVKLITCLTHIRRKFFEAKGNHADMANHALAEIQKLYAVERRAREDNMSAGDRLAFRQTKAKGIYEALMTWIITEQKNNLSKGAIGKALHYAKNQLPRLRHYLDDGRIEIDNNLIENSIRPLALGRKNYLFAGSQQGAQRAAMMYSFFASCKYAGVNPWEWLADALGWIGAHPVNRLEELLPGRWAENQEVDL